VKTAASDTKILNGLVSVTNIKKTRHIERKMILNGTTSVDRSGRPTNVNKYDAKRYGSEIAAFERIETLKTYGIWSGVVRYRDGNFGLTYDPIRLSGGVAIHRVEF
jgi:hypothetical protein